MTNTLHTPQHFSPITFAEKATTEIADPNVSIVHLYNKLHYAQPAEDLNDFNTFLSLSETRISEENLVTWLRSYVFKTLIPETTRLTHETAPTAYLSAYQYTTVQQDTIPAQAFSDAILTHFDTILKDWRGIVSLIERKNTEIHKLKETIIPLDKILKELEEANRKEREKDIARAERRKEKTLHELEQLENLNKELDDLKTQFGWVRNRLVPVRRLEAYIPAVKALTIEGQETFNNYVQLIATIVKFFPELYARTIKDVTDYVKS